jgi:hypothetical protein
MSWNLRLTIAPCGHSPTSTTRTSPNLSHGNNSDYFHTYMALTELRGAYLSCISGGKMTYEWGDVISIGHTAPLSSVFSI